MNTPQAHLRSVGEQLRHWRQRRHLSQLDLAGLADISSRHLSFVETGRSLPSRAMLLRLSDRLEVPLRERNALFVAAGYAPVYSERRIDDPSLEQARKAIDLVLRGHEPYPALAVDRHWQLQAANRALAPLLTGVAPQLLAPPVNVLRLSLHPEGVAPRILNLGQWRAHLLHRLQQQIDATGDAVLLALHAELASYPAPAHDDAPDPDAVVVPMRIRSEVGELSFLSTTTVFGTPVAVTLSELAIESFFPADAATANLLRTGGFLRAMETDPPPDRDAR
ncbi:helix-turn-helix transcriptional regulator [Luteimonas viscosa]|uniref:Helix-turn-helix transcriptional regulator n=1 Tax=Luteimonas viscosa TaxID=1132694 RepID=A0A5D4XKH6_9GAMM|nr:helix-turn-helix transcriptional regulator [Luteimonas viscosa]TYT25198.1 helix-turn-helix transcriptional regulator [Luteimonas viscosa]